MKLCKDCKHFRQHPYANMCYRHVYIEVNLVDGTKSEQGETYCFTERSRNLSFLDRLTNFLTGSGFQDYCGPKGKYYEAMY